jgi:hypothetical protein
VPAKRPFRLATSFNRPASASAYVTPSRPHRSKKPPPGLRKPATASCDGLDRQPAISVTVSYEKAVRAIGERASSILGISAFVRLRCDPATAGHALGKRLAAFHRTGWRFGVFVSTDFQAELVPLSATRRPKKCEHRSLETIGDEKSPHLAGLSHQEKKILRKQEWLAGDAVLIAPVSARIPC